jgi:hypothetical protein
MRGEADSGRGYLIPQGVDSNFLVPVRTRRPATGKNLSDLSENAPVRVSFSEVKRGVPVEGLEAFQLTMPEDSSG